MMRNAMKRLALLPLATRRRRIALAAAPTLLVLLAAQPFLACGDGDSGRATATMTSAGALTPAFEQPAAATPRPVPPTGVPAIDQVVRATLAGDADAIMALLQYERMGCVVPQQEGSPPPCQTGEAPGTIVDSFPIGGCGGTNERPEEARRAVGNTVRAQPIELYSVFRPGAGDADFHIVFAYAGVPERSGFIFEMKDGGIALLRQTCTTVVDATHVVREFIVPPPYGPHAQAPWHLQEASLASFVPTPYNTFMVMGQFDRTIDEVLAIDPFAWSVRGSSVYDGRGRWWRVYWHRGEVFDCAEDCAEALSQTEADARLKALHTGDPVCIIGWTDDVGNVEAEVVYLRPPERCVPPDGFFKRPTGLLQATPRTE